MMQGSKEKLGDVNSADLISSLGRITIGIKVSPFGAVLVFRISIRHPTLNFQSTLIPLYQHFSVNFSERERV